MPMFLWNALSFCEFYFVLGKHLKSSFLDFENKRVLFCFGSLEKQKSGRNLVVVVTCDICKLQCMTDGSYVEF